MGAVRAIAAEHISFSCLSFLSCWCAMHSCTVVTGVSDDFVASGVDPSMVVISCGF